jgi:hypothetical protein
MNWYSEYRYYALDYSLTSKYKKIAAGKYCVIWTTFLDYYTNTSKLRIETTYSTSQL